MLAEVVAVEWKGALVHLSNGMHALVRVADQKVAAGWCVGDQVAMTVASSPVYQLRVETREASAYALLYTGKEPVLPA